MATPYCQPAGSWFIALSLWCIARLEDDAEPIPARRAAPLAMLMGLALFHRPTALFFIVGWIALLFSRLTRPGVFVLTMGVGALPYLHTAWVFFTRVSVAPSGTLPSACSTDKATLSIMLSFVQMDLVSALRSTAAERGRHNNSHADTTLSSRCSQIFLHRVRHGPCG